MYKTDRDKRIEKMHDEKMKRYDKTSESILVSWAINNAVNSLCPPDEWEETKRFIQERYPFFIDLYEKLMAERANLRIDEIIQTAPDEIKKSVAQQEQADSIPQ